MTTDLDIKSAAAVLKILNKVGITVSFNVIDTKVHDVTTGSVTQTTTSTDVVSSPQIEYNDRQIDGDQVQRGDCKIVIGATVITPITGMSVTISGTTWRLVNVKSIKAGDDVAGYLIQLRK